VDALVVKKKELEEELGDPNIWNDREHAKEVTTGIKRIKLAAEPWMGVKKEAEELAGLYYMALEEGEEALEEEIKRKIEDLTARVGRLEKLSLFSGEHDDANAYLTIHSGAGGTEACDWVSMLLRMYLKWAEKNGFKTEVVDILAGEEAGIKSVTAYVKGPYAYGYLKTENGIHRLVRISPFDSNARRHTSFASVFCFPVLDDTIDVDIKPEDLRVDTYRAGGAGGQHVNKTDSAVRLTHLPTGIVVQCQNERSQYKNKAFAMKVLRSRLYEYYKNERDKDREKLEQEKKDISWGNQIRSYTFQPYTLVKDHRTKHEVGNIQAVMDGEIDSFIEEMLKTQWLGKADGGQRSDS
jgi:peptide chain release factor 2